MPHTPELPALATVTDNRPNGHPGILAVRDHILSVNSCVDVPHRVLFMDIDLQPLYLEAASNIS